MTYTGRHRAMPSPRYSAGRSRLAGTLAAAAVTLGLLAGPAALSAQPAQAAVRAPALSTATLGDRVLNKAETKAGSWYRYGAAGPAYFDCSGLASWAAAQLGIYLPHSTYSMLAGTSHLYRVYSPRRGDLAFFGSSHVEFVTAWYHTTFGAHHTGTQIGWRAWSAYYHPTMYLRIR